MTGFPMVESRYRDLIEYEKAKNEAFQAKLLQNQTKKEWSSQKCFYEFLMMYYSHL